MSQIPSENQNVSDDQDDTATEQAVEAVLEGMLGTEEVGKIEAGLLPVVNDIGCDDLPPVIDPKRVTKKRRGFAAMDPKRVSEIAAKGGRAAHVAGTAHEFTKEEAAAAGRLGGYATHAKKREVKRG